MYKNSFHGRTLAAIFASGSKKMTEGFGPRVTGFDHFNFGDHNSLKKKINTKIQLLLWLKPLWERVVLK